MQELRRVLSLKKLMLIVLVAVCNIIFFLYANKPVTDDNILEKETIQHETYLNEYSQNIDTIISNAEKLKKYSIFTKAGTFSYANILRTSEDFERVKNVEVFKDEYKGVKNFTSYYYQYFFTMALMISIVYAFFAQRDNGMWVLTYGSSGGRARYALKQTFVLICAGALIHTIMYWSTFICSMLQNGGFADLNNPIQNVEQFAKFTYPLSKIQYVMLLYCVSLICINCISLIMWAFFVLFRNRNYALIVILIFSAIEQFIYYHIDVHSVWNVLHYINIINLININGTLSSYRNWGTGTFVFPVFSVIIFVLIILTCVMVYISVYVFDIKKPNKNTSYVKRVTDKISAVYQRMIFHMPNIVKELHKLIFTNRCVWIIVVMIGVSVYVCSTGQYYYTDDNMYMDRQYIEHGGIEYSYFQEYIENLQEEKISIETKLEKYSELMNSGDADVADYVSMKQKQQQIVNELKTAQEYEDKIQYIENVQKSYGRQAWMISDRGYEVILGEKGLYRRIMIILALLCGIMLISSDGESLEYKSGMILLERSSAYGRKNIKRNKYVANALFTFSITVAMYSIEYILMKKTYGMPFINAPVISLTFVGNKLATGVYMNGLVYNFILNATIRQLMLVEFFIRLIIAIIIMIAMMWVGRITKGKNKTFTLIAMVIVVICVCIVYGRIYISGNCNIY